NCTPKRRTLAAPSQSVTYVARIPAWSIPTENTVRNPALLAYSSSWWIGLKSPDAPWYRTKSVRVSGPKSRGSAAVPSLMSSHVMPIVTMVVSPPSAACRSRSRWTASRRRARRSRRGTPGSATSSPGRTRAPCRVRRPRRTPRRSGRPPPCSPSVGSFLQELAERRLVEERHPELLGLGELRARILAHDDVAGLLRHAACDLAAARLDLGLRILAGELVEAAREHEGQAGERLLDVGRGSARRALEVDARPPQLLDELPRPLTGEELVHALGHDGPDALHLREVLGRRGEDPVEVAHLAGDVLRGRPADVRNAEADEQPRQLLRLRRLDVVDELARRLLADALE